MVLIAGPCVIESEKIVFRTAEALKNISGRLGIPLIFKSSYLKDNRSSHLTYQGPGVDKGLEILKRVRDDFAIPVLSDVHGLDEVEKAKEVLDIIQLPAYLSQQTG